MPSERNAMKKEIKNRRSKLTNSSIPTSPENIKVYPDNPSLIPTYLTPVGAKTNDQSLDQSKLGKNNFLLKNTGLALGKNAIKKGKFNFKSKN